jgi:Tfp pilus assembly protein PilO
MKLSREQKKLINIAAIVLILSLVFWFGIYNPKRKALVKLKASIDIESAEVEKIQQMIGRETTLEAGVDILKDRIEALNKKCVKQKDISAALKVLSDTANMVRVRLISTRPGSAIAFSVNKKQPLTYRGEVCMKLPVTITVEGKYEQLGRYMQLLENSPVGMYTVDSFSIKKEKAIYPELEMSLTVSIYFLGAKK